MLGTVFELTKPTGEPWKEAVLYNFSGSEGQYPQSTLVFGRRGALFGATVGGGPAPAQSSNWRHPPLRGIPGRKPSCTASATTSNNQNVVPNGPVLIGPGETLYATTQGSPFEEGLIL